MRVPAAKSSGFWVQPCNITTSGNFLPLQPGGLKCLYASVLLTSV